MSLCHRKRLEKFAQAWNIWTWKKWLICASPHWPHSSLLARTLWKPCCWTASTSRTTSSVTWASAANWSASGSPLPTRYRPRAWRQSPSWADWPRLNWWEPRIFLQSNSLRHSQVPRWSDWPVSTCLNAAFSTTTVWLPLLIRVDCSG